VSAATKAANAALRFLCRHLPPTDPVVKTVERGGFTWPEALNDAEEEQECWDPAEEGCPVPYTPATMYCGKCDNHVTVDPLHPRCPACELTVPALKWHHRDRVWRDDSGDEWRFMAGTWHYRRTGHLDAWIDTYTAEDADRDETYGPFTEVPQDSAPAETSPAVEAETSPVEAAISPDPASTGEDQTRLLAVKARGAANTIVEVWQTWGAAPADYNKVWQAKEYLHEFADGVLGLQEKPQR
jgi:hypothetical protein